MHSFNAASSLSLLSVLSGVLVAAEPVKLGFTKSVASVPRLVRRADGFVEESLMQSQYKNMYTINVTIGTPGQQFALQLDTGSSDLWVPAVDANACTTSPGCADGSFDPQKSSTFTQLSQGGFNISYDAPGDSDSGYYFSDVVAMKDVKLDNVTIGLATYAADNTGLMGVGFASLESYVQSGEGQTGYPTVVDSLVSAGIIERAAFSLYLDDLKSNTGSILFGGVDTSKYSGNLVSLPIQLDTAANMYDRYLVTLTSISITDKSGTRLLSDPNLSVAALLDSGTTDSILPADVTNSIWAGLGAVQSQGSSFVPCSLQNTDASLSFGFGGPGGPTIKVPLSSVISNAALPPNSAFPDGKPACLLAIDSQANDPSGSVILGDSFLRSAYVVYDLANNEIAIAQAKYGASSENIQAIPSGSGLPGVSSTATEAAPTALVTALPAPQTGAGSGATNVPNPSSPTFALGSAASAAGTAAGTGTGTAGSSSSPQASSTGGSTSSGSVPVAVVQPATFGISVVLGVAALFGAMIL